MSSPASCPRPDDPCSTFFLRVAIGRCWISESSLRHLDLPADASRAVKLINALTGPQAKVLHTFKDDRRSQVCLTEHEGLRWVVKWYRSAPWKTCWYHLVRRTPAWREWTSARQLRRVGVRVIDPMALVHRAKFGRWAQILITPFIDGPSLHHFLKDSLPAELLDLREKQLRIHMARSIGRQIGRISSAGFMNRDHKASNIIIDERCREMGAEPVLIDPARVKRTRRERQMHLMVARLLRSARRAGPVSPAECAAVLRGVFEDQRRCRKRHKWLHAAADGIERLDHELQSKLASRRDEVR